VPIICAGVFDTISIEIRMVVFAELERCFIGVREQPYRLFD
jgi:hypothetical protein